jgi:uncharacterized protein YuzE
MSCAIVGRRNSSQRLPGYRLPAIRTTYDKSTDSLYVEVRPLPSCRTVEIEEDIMVDTGSNGQRIGYDIQHASGKAEFIARLILEQTRPAAAE